MNKLLHALIYILLAVTGTLMYFELQLDKKRQLLGDRNLALETALVNLASTIETNAPERAILEDADSYRLDRSPVEANPGVDIEYEDVLDEGYALKYETLGAPVYGWNNADTRLALREIYKLDANGEPVPDKVNPGKFDQTGTRMAALVEELERRSKEQLDTLNETRKELKKVREKLPPVIRKYNDLAKIARADKDTIVKRDQTIEGLEDDKRKLSDDVANRDRTIKEQNGEIASLNEQVQLARNETALKQEELDKAVKLSEQLERSLRQAREDLRKAQQAAANSGGAVAGFGGGSISSILSDGTNKGVVKFCDNQGGFCVVEFSEDALKEMLGDDLSAPVPMGELLVRRPAEDGGLGKVVGRIRLRNHTRNSPYVLADIVAEGRLEDFQPGDIVFPE